MNSVEVVARGVEEAIAEALVKLNATRDEVKITILDEGNKGLFGLIGNKNARVKVEKIEQVEQVKQPEVAESKLDRVKEYVEELLQKMAVPAQVIVEMDEDNIKVNVQGENLGLLIGRRGQTLDAFQYLVALSVNKEQGDWTRVIVDVEGYRDRREETLRALANRLAGKAQATGRKVALDPMNPMERRIVHQELQEFGGVETHSEGREPYRRVVIIPKS